MSYDNNNDRRREGYGQDEGSHSGSGGGDRGGEAADYYNQGERPSGGAGQRGRYGDDDQAEQYGGQGGGGRRHETDIPGAGYGEGAYEQRSGGHQDQQEGGRHDHYNSGGGGYGGHQSSGGRHEDDDSYRTSDGGGGYGGGAGAGGSGYDQNEAISQARKHGNDEDGNLFSHAMSFLGQNKHDQDGELDEQQMIGAHQKLYGNQNSAQPHDSNSLGAGAAMQALKIFTGGGAGHGGQGSQGGGNSQSQFIGIAMAQAGKLFDQQSGQGNVASGADKQSAVNSAAKMAMQLYMKSEGGGGGGGPGGLMGLAGKFL